MCAPINEEIIQAKMELMNSEDEYTVAAVREGHILAHLKKELFQITENFKR